MFDLKVGIKADAIREIGDQLARFGYFIGQNVQSTLGKVTNKITNFNKDKFNKALTESEILLRVIDDTKFASTEDLQEIRARIIAREYENPNSISLRSLAEINKLSAKEFFWFEENIAPFIIKNKFCNLNLRFHRNEEITDYMLDNAFPDLDLCSGNLASITQNGIIILNFKFCTLKMNYHNQLEHLFAVHPLTQYLQDLNKLCEPKPWKDEWINATKAELTKLGLVEGQDFEFKINSNQ